MSEQQDNKAPELKVPRGIELNMTLKPVKIDIDIDMSTLTWGEVRKMQTMDTNSEEFVEMATQLVSKVIGQDADKMPPSVVMAVLNYVMGEMGTETPAVKN